VVDVASLWRRIPRRRVSKGQSQRKHHCHSSGYGNSDQKVLFNHTVGSREEVRCGWEVGAPITEFPRRCLDRGVGVAVGWVYWFAYAVMAADQLAAVSNLVSFNYDDGTTYLDWKVGETVDPAVWEYIE
jgi:hypothetical protein